MAGSWEAAVHFLKLRGGCREKALKDRPEPKGFDTFDGASVLACELLFSEGELVNCALFARSKGRILRFLSGDQARTRERTCWNKPSKQEANFPSRAWRLWACLRAGQASTF